jgi:alkanesulfonate monooxygenase SsuD/methylene tetrahydromethanopterin reductase-like flavin-dependent oxidoreductase (luciferase family)
MIGIPNWERKERVARLAEYLEIVDRLLRDEVTSFEGDFYRIDGAYMNPRPVQSPRPPIMVGALGPVMMRHAARRADTWNSLSFHASFEDQLAETRRRADLMVEYCAELAREPTTLRRSYLMFDATARPRGGSIDYYDSAERFEEMANRIIDLGMDEIGVYYPLDVRQVPVFERIATDVMPRLRAARAGA